MVQNIITSDTKAPLLNAKQTQQFINKMDTLLKNFDFKAIIGITKNYPFNAIDQNELNDFIDRAELEHTNWYENPLDIKINAVEAFDTKCIACNFGKTVKAYRVVFNEMKAKIAPGRINYGRSLAIYFEMKNNELFDFGWCNAFLEKNEIAELNTT